MEGNLQERKLGEVLLSLARQARTGILTIQGEQEIIAFSFLEGSIVSADALNQSLEDGLGEVISGLGLVSTEQFAGLAAEYQAGGGRVIDLLVERGFLTREQLLEALRQHNYRLCLQALSWTRGEFKFYQGEEVAHEQGVRPLPVEELLVRASRGGEAVTLPGPVPDSTAVFGRARSAFETGKAGSRGGESSLELVATEELGREAGVVFGLVDGRRTISEIAAACGVSEFKVAYFVHRWSRANLVEQVGSAPEKPRPTAPPAGPPARPKRAAARPARPRRWRRILTGLDPGSWLLRLLGAAGLVLVAALVLLRPDRVLMPFPWQRELARELEASRASAALAQIDRAARTFFLLEGRFPEELAGLERRGLVRAGRLAEVTGEFDYSANPVSFVVQASAGGAPTGLTGSIGGDFLLDPEFAPPPASAVTPLVLLD